MDFAGLGVVSGICGENTHLGLDRSRIFHFDAGTADKILFRIQHDNSPILYKRCRGIFHEGRVIRRDPGRIVPIVDAEVRPLAVEGGSSRKDFRISKVPFDKAGLRTFPVDGRRNYGLRIIGVGDDLRRVFPAEIIADSKTADRFV